MVRAGGSWRAMSARGARGGEWQDWDGGDATTRAASEPCWRVVSELSALWADDQAEGSVACDQVVPTVPGEKPVSRRAVHLRASGGGALRRGLGAPA
jgi:hypothetical protein